MPLIMTHGWPGSVIELLETVGPLTDPTAHGGTPEDAFHLVLPSLPGYGFSGEPTELGWESGRIARAWAELMDRLGYTRYVAQGGDVAPTSLTRWAAKDPRGWSASTSACSRRRSPSGPLPTESEQERAAARGARRRSDGRLRLLPRAVHPAADDRLLAAGFTRRAGGLDARPRHRQLLQDLPRVRRRQARGQSHPGEHRRQHHAVLADGHRHLGRPVVLGVRTVRGRSRRRARLLRRSRSRSASRRSPARSGLPRAAGSRRSTPASPTSTRSTGAATSPPGRSQSSSPPKCGLHSAHCADDASRTDKEHAAQPPRSIAVG